MHKAEASPRKELPVRETKQAVLKALRLGALHKFQIIHHLPNPVPEHYNALRIALKELRDEGLVAVKGEKTNAVYYLTSLK